MRTRDIHEQIQELYGMGLSAEMTSKITGRILPQIKGWESRPLDPIHPFISKEVSPSDSALEKIPHLSNGNVIKENTQNYKRKFLSAYAT